MYLDEDNFLIVSDIITKGRKSFFISKKRSIKLLQPGYLGVFIEEFDKLISK